MTDGIIKGTGNSRYLKSVSNFLTLYPDYASLARGLVAGNVPIDLNGLNPGGWSTQGTQLNKATLLSDSTATALELSDDNATPDGAINTIRKNIYSNTLKLGSYSNASGVNTTAVGAGAAAKTPYATALGSSSNAYGGSSISLGRQSKADTDFSVAMGPYAHAEGDSAIAIGCGDSYSTSANARGNYSIALGFNAYSGYTALYSIAIGARANANSGRSIAIGGGNSAANAACFGVSPKGG